MILFPDTEASADAVGSEIDRLQRAAAAGGEPPLIVAIDQEGGPVKRFVEAPPVRSPYDLGRSGRRADAVLEGRATGTFLRRLGVNVDLAPVLDVPASPDSVISFRAFGTTPEAVAQLGLGFAAGLERREVLATAKHFPGLGRSLVNTDLAPTEINASKTDLRRDLEPFEAAVRSGIPLVMVGLAAYPAYGGREPAALSPQVIQGLLRDRLGYRGLVITDDLGAGAITAGHSADEAAVDAARAGADLLLYARQRDPGVTAALAASAQRGRIPVADLRRSCVRVIDLRRSLAATSVP